MFRSPARARVARWLHTVAVVLALVSQLGLTLASLDDGRRGRSWASHVDAGGTSQHYAHDDATCVSCQVQSLYGAASRAAPPELPDAARPQAPAALVARPPARSFTPHASPRAPPVVS